MRDESRTDLANDLVAELTDEVAGLLGRAAALAEAGRGARGRAAGRRSLAMLLEVEPLLREVRGLIAAASVLRERADERRAEGPNTLEDAGGTRQRRPIQSGCECTTPDGGPR